MEGEDRYCTVDVVDIAGEVVRSRIYFRISTKSQMWFILNFIDIEQTGLTHTEVVGERCSTAVEVVGHRTD